MLGLVETREEMAMCCVAEIERYTINIDRDTAACRVVSCCVIVRQHSVCSYIK